MAADMAIGKTLNAKIAQNLKQISKGEQGKIQTVIVFRYGILNPKINSKNKKWLYQEVDKNQKQHID